MLIQYIAVAGSVTAFQNINVVFDHPVALKNIKPLRNAS
jgi:hypothetical protein